MLLRNRDDIIRAMKKGELTFMVLADYFKAFDVSLGFSKTFVYWIANHLCDRFQ